MNWRKLEDRLFKHILFQRIILAVLLIGSIVCAIVSYSLLMNSKEVIEYGSYITFEEVRYNYDYLTPFSLGTSVALFSAFFLIVNLFYTKFRTVALGPDVITVYRGIFISRLFVNGEKRGTRHRFSIGLFIETELANNLVINVNFIGNRLEPVAHISFSDNTSSLTI